MKIKAVVDFKEGRQQFEKDKVYEVSDGPGYYFCRNGWAVDLAGVAPTGEAGAEPVTLKIDDVMLGHNAPTVGEGD